MMATGPPRMGSIPQNIPQNQRNMSANRRQGTNQIMVQASTNLAMEDQPQYIQRKAGNKPGPSPSNAKKQS